MGQCICPKCKSNNIIPIMYGYSAPSAIEEAERGNLILGGCEVYIGGGQPDRFCKDCEHEWCVENFLSEDITKVRFRYWTNWGCCGSESFTEEQWAFEIFPDGVIKYYAYPRAGRKALDKDKVQIDASRVIAFYDDLLQVFKPWYDFVDCKVCDGCSYELNITYIDGRKKKRTGDVGGGSIDKTIMEFLCTIPEMKEKIMEEE